MHNNIQQVVSIHAIQTHAPHTQISLLCLFIKVKSKPTQTHVILRLSESQKNGKCAPPHTIRARRMPFRHGKRYTGFQHRRERRRKLHRMKSLKFYFWMATHFELKSSMCIPKLSHSDSKQRGKNCWKHDSIGKNTSDNQNQWYCTCIKVKSFISLHILNETFPISSICAILAWVFYDWFSQLDYFNSQRVTLNWLQKKFNPLSDCLFFIFCKNIFTLMFLNIKFFWIECFCYE